MEDLPSHKPFPRAGKNTRPGVFPKINQGLRDNLFYARRSPLTQPLDISRNPDGNSSPLKIINVDYIDVKFGTATPLNKRKMNLPKMSNNNAMDARLRIFLTNSFFVLLPSKIFKPKFNFQN